MIRAILVDDEEHALHLLEYILNQIGGVEVIGKSSNPSEVVEACKRLKPNVVFLDIEMPEMDGVELVEILKSDNMDLHAVFVTAHHQYAISAFEQGAIDYLLKPIEMERLEKTINRLRRELGKTSIALSESTSPIFHASFAPPKLHIQCLGGFEVFNSQNNRLIWRTSKEKELLAFLATHGNTRAHRDVIIDTLWQEEDYQKAKIYLHTCISNIRKNIKKLGFVDIILYEDSNYYLNQTKIHIDYIQIKQSLEQIKQPAPKDTGKIEQILEQYHAPLLFGCDYPWIEKETEYLHRSVMEARLELAQTLLEQGAYKQAVEVGRLVLNQNPGSEEACRILMRCYQKTGNHDAVFLSYQRLVQALNELHIEPSPQTKLLYREITLIN
ncbi:response regulator [Brevibacillus sp. SYSU BS000544]|uniref:response regulator n=1 Tax=Brevibacillus sp. SYSU BS000544 TaxID=3416443 RepID=UPI003CE4EA54